MIVKKPRMLPGSDKRFNFRCFGLPVLISGSWLINCRQEEEACVTVITYLISDFSFADIMPTSQELYLIDGRSDKKGIGNLKVKGIWHLNF